MLLDTRRLFVNGDCWTWIIAESFVSTWLIRFLDMGDYC
jgi:hypothetical protein